MYFSHLTDAVQRKKLAQGLFSITSTAAAMESSHKSGKVLSNPFNFV